MIQQAKIKDYYMHKVLNRNLFFVILMAVLLAACNQNSQPGAKASLINKYTFAYFIPVNSSA